MKITTVAKLVTACCECKKLLVEGQWVDEHDVEIGDALLSHGYCPHCYEIAVNDAILMLQSRGLRVASVAA